MTDAPRTLPTVAVDRRRATGRLAHWLSAVVEHVTRPHLPGSRAVRPPRARGVTTRPRQRRRAGLIFCKQCGGPWDGGPLFLCAVCSEGEA